MSFTLEDYNSYMASPEWAEKRQKRIQIDDHKCRMCGRTDHETVLTVHHIRYNSFRNENIYSDLVTLCPSCHTAVHVLMNRPTGILPNGTIKYGWKNDLPYGIRQALSERGLM